MINTQENIRSPPWDSTWLLAGGVELKESPVEHLVEVSEQGSPRISQETPSLYSRLKNRLGIGQGSHGHGFEEEDSMW